MHNQQNIAPTSQLSNHDALLFGKNVLIADDDYKNTFALSKILRRKGMNIFVAENGQQALDVLENQPDIDIVLMDIMMPVMDGYEAIEQIRQLRRFDKLPVLAVTAKAMSEDREKCLSTGANDYISKPINKELLYSVMNKWLQA